MKTQINTTLVLAILISFLLGAGIMHYSGRGYMDHGRDQKNSAELLGGHQMPDGTVMGGDNMMMKKEEGMSMESMMMSMNANLKGKSGRELEKAFLTEMIPHHEGAIVMAQTILADKTVRPELTKLATDIVSAQQTEITQMKKWLAEYK